MLSAWRAVVRYDSPEAAMTALPDLWRDSPFSRGPLVLKSAFSAFDTHRCWWRVLWIVIVIDIFLLIIILTCYCHFDSKCKTFRISESLLNTPRIKWLYLMKYIISEWNLYEKGSLKIMLKICYVKDMLKIINYCLSIELIT